MGVKFGTEEWTEVAKFHPNGATIRISLAAGAAKNVEFFVCMFVCLFVRHWNVRFCAPDFARRWNTETILISLDRGRFVVVHPSSTFSDCSQRATSQNAEIQKRKHFFRHQRATE